MSQDQQPPAPPAAEPKPKGKRGFASMDPKVVSAIARKGGQAAHQAGTAHKFSSDEAREAGRKGGAAKHGKRAAAEPLALESAALDEGEE
jgi:general stress protein YciG